ncbi:putative basic proline-rich protein [Iris pallida]|uniref:Basic proline-rich protein n=1 Tax=Iris pallida TaxID=29817 RepID=A0AAX6IH98_IRIPA|nr:putative basic proline-rich protein [Iris pallida]
MEKTPISSSSTDNRDSTSTHILKSLNKNSYKISKPTATTTDTRTNPNPSPNPNPSQSQPPVYNIDKSDFREVVQKLTGSPAHLRPSPSEQQPPPPPPPPADPPQPFARLHRIRPPPLSHLSARPASAAAATPALSPLPPLPTVSAAAESPITAYMRRLRGGPSPTTASALPPPSSPLGFFGCVPPSPRTAAASLLLPTSPRMPAPSPR